MPTFASVVVSALSAGSLWLVCHFAQEPVALWHLAVVFAISFVFLKV